MKPIEFKSETDDRAGMTLAQIAARAIQASENLANVIFMEYPQIADDYIGGLNQREIAIKYSLDKVGGIDIARIAVGKALRKLIRDEEKLRELGREKRIESSKRVGKMAFQEKFGFFDTTPEEHLKRSSKAGKATRDAKAGIFSLTEEERRENAKYASKRGMIKQGKTLWVTGLIESVSGLNEVEYLLDLAKKSEYIHQDGPRKGCFNSIKISKKLNEVFHQGRQVRTPSSVSTKLVRLMMQK